MTTYAIFKERYASLKEEMVKPHYRAVPQEYLRTGIFDPRHHMEIEPDVLDQIEAKTPVEAVARFEEKRANAFM